MNNKLIYGLDFGTSNTVVAIVQDGTTKILPIGKDGKDYIPSLILSLEERDRYWIGEDAITKYIEHEMRGRLMQSIKMFLPDKFSDEIYVPTIGFCSLARLISLILTKVKKRADEYVGADVKSVVLGRPGRFSKSQEEEDVAEKRLIEAAQMAGFEEIMFQREPIAAAFYYETTLTSPERALIVDLGGGTSDFTIAQLSPKRVGQKDRASDILGTNSVSYAGDNFDSAIIWNKLGRYFGAHTRYSKYFGSSETLEVPEPLVKTITDWRMIPSLRNRQTREFIKTLINLGEDPDAIKRLQYLVDTDVGFPLFKSVERAKCALSSQEQASFAFHHGLLSVEGTISNQEFTSIATEGMQKLEDCLEELMRESGHTPEMIDSVFMTGGTSQLPCIRKMFEKKFGLSKIHSGSAFVSVAAGLAISARQLA